MHRSKSSSPLMVKVLHDLAGVSLQRSDVMAVRAAWSASRSRVKRPGFWL
jgi:hypothetical protein